MLATALQAEVAAYVEEFDDDGRPLVVRNGYHHQRETLAAAGAVTVAASADNQPWIEDIADLTDPNVAEVFHAMMLRSGLITRLGLDPLVDPDYRPQRA